MIVAEKPLNVTTSGIESKKFGIVLNRKMFRILSADLYSDKIRAIIRELGTNAADAHVAAGKKDVPFDVHLPNSFEPFFEIKDYGTGLSKEQMFGIYTQYGASDKTGTNEQTGCLGLGSKSPFAYTDSFTVESRYNGTKTVYTAYLGEDGFPALSEPLTEDKTDEPNGLTVKFPVKQPDFYHFCNKAEETYKWFKVRPNVRGNRDYVVEKRPEMLRATDFYAVTKERTGSSYVVMGNVAYPIQVNQVASRYNGDDEEAIATLLHWGVELYVKIGDVDFTASREALSYDDDETNNKRTVPFIKEQCRKVLKDLEAEVTKDIAAKPTLWEARRALNDVRRGFTGFNFTATWNGQTITDNVKVPADKCIAETLKRKSYKHDNLKVTKDRCETIYADGSKVFLNDGHGGYAAIRRYLETQDHGTKVYLLSAETDVAWLAETGLDAVVQKTSTLPKPVRTPGLARGGAAKAKVYEFVPTNSNSAADYWKPAEIDLEDDGEFVFVEILYFNYRTEPDKETQSPNCLKSFINTVERVSGTPVKVYGIRPSDRANILEKSEGEWLWFKDYAKRVCDKAGVKLHAQAVKALQYERVTDRHDLYRLGENRKFDTNSAFGKFIKNVKDAKKAKDDTKVAEYLRLLNTISVEEIKDTDVLRKEQEAVYEAYPMLNYINWYNVGTDFHTAVVSYIEAVDNKKVNDGAL